VYPKGKPLQLKVVEAGGKETIVPAKLDQTVAISTPEGTLRIVKIFTHLRVMHNRIAVNMPGSFGNPALRIELATSDGKKSYLYAYAKARGVHGQEADKPKVTYLVPEPVAEPDPDTALPAMELLLVHKDKRVRKWLLAEAADRVVAMPLAELLALELSPPEGHGPDDGHGHRPPDAYLVMGPRVGPPKDYKSDLAILDEGQEVPEAAKVIEVNHPLHYRGYHFYQSSYDAQRGQFTVLFVKSDSGLLAVYAGFILLCGGGFWLFWVQPARDHFSKRADHGD